MNVHDILKYGDKTFLSSIDKFPDAEYETEGACGWWSVKDIAAHITSYEELLRDVLVLFTGGGDTPIMNRMRELRGKFNDSEVRARRDASMEAVLDSHKTAHARVIELAAKIPAEKFRENGTIPWYGPDYCLDDFIVYTNYAHKREHAGQIDVFGDRYRE